MANTNNTNVTVNGNNTTASAEKKGATTMANETRTEFKVNYGTGKVIIDTTSHNDIILNFGLHKISYDAANSPENRDAWKAVKAMVLKPEDNGGLGLLKLGNLNTKKNYDEMCELFLNIAEKKHLITHHDAELTREENGLVAPEDFEEDEVIDQATNKNDDKISKIFFSWKDVRGKKNQDGTPMSDTNATVEWFKENIGPILENIVEDSKKAGSEAMDSLSRVELKARKDLYESFGKDDVKLVSLLKGVHKSMEVIKRFNSRAYREIKQLYGMSGIVRASEIHRILVNTSAHCYAFFNESDDQVTREMGEYLNAGKNLIGYTYKLRLWIRRTARKTKAFLGVDVEGTIANRVYRILRGIFNTVVYGTKVIIELGTIAVSGVTSFAIFVGGKAYEGICWLIEQIKKGFHKKDEVDQFGEDTRKPSPINKLVPSGN